MIRRTTIAALIVAGLLLSACSEPKPPDEVTSSSLVVKLTLEELVAHADWIVVGTVTGQKSQWDADHNHIYTLVTIAVEEWGKGESDDNEIVINIPGGEVGEVTQRVEDVPSFQKGERVLVYLQPHDDGSAGVVGGWQGKFVIENGNIIGSDLSLAELVSQIKTEVNKASE